MSADLAPRPRATTRPVKKLMVANRSEIAIRIFRAATELGMRTVAIYATRTASACTASRPTRPTWSARAAGPVAAYLDIDGIVALAKEKGVDAIHPGYGFLSENAEFARACEAAGISFVGPEPGAAGALGDKTAARALAEAAGVPDPARHRGAGQPTAAEAPQRRATIGFPLIIKAAFGGGGRGMRVVEHGRRARAACSTRRSARPARRSATPPSSSRSYIRARQAHRGADPRRPHGNVVHLYERDCSVQRRHQKVVEIAPASDLPEALRGRALRRGGRALARAVGYDNAGTVEFLVDVDRNEWFFIEVNPRIQVEHTVTEVVTGIDLVRARSSIAQGHQLHGARDRPAAAGRDADATATPCSAASPPRTRRTTSSPDYGRILTYRSPGGLRHPPRRRHGFTGAVITPFYDSLLVKVTTCGRDFARPRQRAWTARCASSASAA